MSLSIKIEIPGPATDQIVHRFRNLGEDVYRDLKAVCSLDIEEIDRATTSFVVRQVRPRDIGHVTQVIKRQLRAHNFEHAIVTRLA
jgi:hypothetical protein